MKKLESLFVKKMFLENLIQEASIKGEANHRIERLEEALKDVEYEIDIENIKAFA
jgi:hypothetical protein